MSEQFRMIKDPPVEVCVLRKTGPETATITLSVCQMGSFVTAGRTSKISIDIEDSDMVRQLSAHLNHLKENNYPGVVDIRFSEGHWYSMDQSIWIPIADALFAFSLCVDCAKFGL